MFQTMMLSLFYKLLVLLGVFLLVRCLEDKKIECPPGTHKCDEQLKCVPDEKVCDYFPDCKDSSDENFKLCKVVHEHKYECSAGQIYDGKDCQNIYSYCESNKSGEFNSTGLRRMLCSQLACGLQVLDFKEIFSDFNLLESIGYMFVNVTFNKIHEFQSEIQKLVNKLSLHGINPDVVNSLQEKENCLENAAGLAKYIYENLQDPTNLFSKIQEYMSLYVPTRLTDKTVDKTEETKTVEKTMDTKTEDKTEIKTVDEDEKKTMIKVADRLKDLLQNIILVQ